ncbi:MAG: TonB-dependent receptor [Burkholderiaceae bacterium]|nr:TonB-dependent receptor [Burkholderiaceae bacterium]
MRTPRSALVPALLAASAPALAQPTQPSATGTLEPVTITATRIEQRSFDAAAAIDILGADAIGAATRGVNLSEAVGRVPGVNVQDRQNFAQDLQVASRGFGARAAFGVRGVRLVQDGIPFTMPDGQGQTGLFDLDAAARIEVLRGPFAALYGNSSGGLITLFTEDPPQRPTWRATANAGSHGSRKLGIGYGDTIGALGLRANASRFETDGYRAHSRARRDLAGVRLAWSPDADTSLALNATLLDQPDTEDPLGLTRQQLAQDPRQAGTGAAAFDTRKSVDHRQLGLSWERRLNAHDRVRLRGHLGDRHVRQFLAFSGEAPSSSGGVVDLERGFGGTGLQWSRSQPLAGGRVDVAIGIEYDRMHERRRGYVNDFGIAGALRRDEMNTVSSFDQYAIGEWWFTPVWKLSGGLRRSRVAFDVSDDFVTPVNPDDSGSRRYSATNPVIGVLHALSDTVNLYASAGRGFETPTFAELAYRPDGQPGLNFALEPSRSTNYEAGIKLMPGRATRVNFALFHTRTRNDIVPDANVAGRTTFRNAARTVRRGIELGVESRFGEGFSGALAWTWIDARFRDYPGLTGADLSGKAIPGLPKSSLYGELGWRHAPSGFTTGIEARRNASVAVDDANSERAGSYTVFNWRAGFDWQTGGWQVAPFVRIDNVSDRRYVGSVIVNAANGRYYEPAPRRTFLLGATASYAF